MKTIFVVVGGILPGMLGMLGMLEGGCAVVACDAVLFLDTWT